MCHCHRRRGTGDNGAAQHAWNQRETRSAEKCPCPTTTSALKGTGSDRGIAGLSNDDARDELGAPVRDGRAKEFLATGFGQLLRRYLSAELQGTQRQALPAGDVETQRKDLPAELVIAHVERHPQVHAVRCGQTEKSLHINLPRRGLDEIDAAHDLNKPNRRARFIKRILSQPIREQSNLPPSISFSAARRENLLDRSRRRAYFCRASPISSKKLRGATRITTLPHKTKRYLQFRSSCLFLI